MAHYAFIDENNIVTEVIVGKDETDTSHDWEQYYGAVRGQICKRTSYNTIGGQHPDGNPYRKNYAGVGFVYDPVRDAFIPPKPPVPNDGRMYTLNEDTCLWEEII